jgi:hypothetical protein
MDPKCNHSLALVEGIFLTFISCNWALLCDVGHNGAGTFLFVDLSWPSIR